MFKGILPSKRISSSDFTMIAGPGIGDVPQFGKEIQNKPEIIPQQTVLKPGKPAKGFGKSNEKQKTLKTKEKGKEGKDQSGEPVMTEEAFDKLLVRMMILL